ncbi:MAG: Signal peptidase I [Parcubacteria group bacterium GW2011_GWC2_39_14]|nr:MAG: Signal peptidase I [Parcubacteria group bacterium GW2011_GWC2_39_14]KKR54757.1 MAG: Signal peptidase I [Parcubacteria group bacterium GW2011_GWA2_40_23]
MQTILLLLIVFLALTFIFHVAILQACLKIFKIQNRNVKGTIRIAAILMLWTAIFAVPNLYYGKGPLVVFASLISLVGIFFILRYFLRKNNQISTKKVFGLFIAYYISSFIVMALGVALIRATLFMPFYTAGAAMEPNFKAGDYMLIKRINIEIDRGDAIVFIDPSNDTKTQYFLKRVVGLPGEKIVIKDGNLLINGEILSESAYLPTGEKTPGEIDTLLKDDEYFVLGDNRDQSYDSRKFGSITKEGIIGKVWVRPGITINLPER